MKQIFSLIMVVFSVFALNAHSEEVISCVGSVCRTSCAQAHREVYGTGHSCYYTDEGAGPRQAIAVCPNYRPTVYCKAPRVCSNAQFYDGANNACQPKCESGFLLNTAGVCEPISPCPTGTSCAQPQAEEPDQGNACTISGNPINTATGNKFQTESDFDWGNGLNFVRSYNGSSRVEQGIGAGWRHGFMRRIVPVELKPFGYAPANSADPDWNALPYVVKTPAYYLIERQDGKSFSFELNGQPRNISRSNTYQLIVNADGFIVKDGLNTETYNKLGKLLEIVPPNGRTTTLTYDSDNRLRKVIDGLGRQLLLTYDGDSIYVNNIQANGVTVASYSYDKGRLAKVTYADNSTRQYLYEDTRNPYLLTGIIDESGNRFASWTYNEQSQAISSEHAGGVDKYTLNFGGDQTNGPRWTDETDPLGSVRRYNFKKVAGSWLLDGKNQPGGAGCSAATSGMTYDANGNVATRTDFNGNLTTYVYDLARNLETSRTEAKGTPQQRIITTEWHPTWRLISKVTEPGRVTTYDWDNTTANLNSKTITADSKTRVWAWTYFDKGLVKTATDPDGKVTSYTYDTAGNVSTMTNPLGQVTQFNRYDANGNLLEMTAPDGLKTTLTYDARNRLKTRQTGTALTSLEYWPTGLLKTATLPNGLVINYVYDAAQRLREVNDNRGNREVYTLNNLGQPEQTDRTDPDNTLGVGLAQVKQTQTLSNAVVKPK